MFEYRLIYQWDAEHWTCITSSELPTDIHQYAKKHLEEMQEAAEDAEAAGIAECYALEYYYDGTLAHKWVGNPDDILEVITKITNEWLERAFK